MKDGRYEERDVRMHLESRGDKSDVHVRCGHHSMILQGDKVVVEGSPAVVHLRWSAFKRIVGAAVMMGYEHMGD